MLDSLVNKNMQDRLALDNKISHRSVENGMVLHHHLDSLDRLNNIDRNIDVEQDALRPGQLDSLDSINDGNIRDGHRNILNVGHAFNREVHGSRIVDLDKVQVDNEVDRNSLDN